MTFNNAPWAVDGARSTAALARLAAYATGGGRSGIVKPTDLKVSALAVPGNGLLISRGSAVVLNNYQTNPNETYAISNPGTHTVLSSDMPAAISGVGYYLVCAVVGDPEFSQSGHPFMPSDVPEEDAADFEYVRVVIVPCTSTTTSFDELGLDYPAISLARLEIPALTTTITNAMIVDLRELAQPRTERHVFMSETPPNQWLVSPTFVDWPTFQPTVKVPPWATKIFVTVTLSNIVAFQSVDGALRALAGPLTGATLGYDIDGTPGSGQRSTMIVAVGGDISGSAGTTITLKVQGRKDNPPGDGNRLDSWTLSHMVYDVQFEEAVI